MIPGALPAAAGRILRKRAVLALLLAALILPALLFVPIRALTIRLSRSGDNLVFAAPANENSIFSMSYIHSVEKALVKGIFTIGPNKDLILSETHMESVGTGLPVEAQECIGREGRWRVAGGEPMVLPEFRFRYHRINSMTMQYQGEQIPIEDTRDNELLTLQVEKITLASFLFQRLTRRFHGPRSTPE